VVRIRIWCYEDLMPSVWPSDSDQNRVLPSKVGSDVTFSFASKLPSDDHVDNTRVVARIQAKMGRCTDENICGRTQGCVYDHVRGELEAIDLCFSRIAFNLCIRFQFVEPGTSSVEISLFQNVAGRFEVHVDHVEPIRLTNRANLIEDSDGVHDDLRSRCPRQPLQGIQYPFPVGFPV